jgi:hypothetical protein
MHWLLAYVQVLLPPYIDLYKEEEVSNLRVLSFAIEGPAAMWSSIIR